MLVFDPTRVTDGIELTDDEILRTRADVYAESVLYRSVRSDARSRQRRRAPRW